MAWWASPLLTPRRCSRRRTRPSRSAPGCEPHALSRFSTPCLRPDKRLRGPNTTQIYGPEQRDALPKTLARSLAPSRALSLALSLSRARARARFSLSKQPPRASNHPGAHGRETPAIESILKGGQPTKGKTQQYEGARPAIDKVRSLYAHDVVWKKPSSRWPATSAPPTILCREPLASHRGGPPCNSILSNSAPYSATTRPCSGSATGAFFKLLSVLTIKKAQNLFAPGCRGDPRTPDCTQ